MKFRYDLHVHSVLSACASRDNDLINVVNMARVCGIEVLAITDHNSGANVKSALEIARRNGVLLIPGIEVTTAEDVHVLCYFRDIKELKAFSAFLEKLMPRYPLVELLYYPQVIEDASGEETGRVKNLLGVGVDLSIYEVVEEVRKWGGVCVPAHIDRKGGGIIGTLGAIPDDLGFTAVEVTKNCSEQLRTELEEHFLVLTNSDAHCLESIAANKNFIEMKSKSIEAFFDAITRK